MVSGMVRGLVGDAVGAHEDLALGDLAPRARILVRDTDRATSLLGQPSVVQHQDTLGWTLRHQDPHTLLVQGLGKQGQHIITISAA